MKKLIMFVLAFTVLSCQSDDVVIAPLAGEVLEPNIYNPFEGENDGSFEQENNVIKITRRKYSEDIFTVYQSSVKYYVRPNDNSIRFSLLIEDVHGNVLERRDNLTGLQRTVEKRTTSILGNNESTEMVTDSYILKIITESPNEFTVDVRVSNSRIRDGQGATNFYVSLLSENN
jgi:hypothetical protein